MQEDLESIMLDFHYRMFDRIEFNRARDYLQQSGFGIAPVEASGWKGNFIALVGFRSYDIFVFKFDFNDADAENGISINNQNEAAFIKLNPTSAKIFREKPSNLGLDLFFPHYANRRTNFYDDRLDNFLFRHEVYIGTKIPEGTLIDASSITWRYGQKKILSAEQAQNENPEVFRQVSQRIEKERLDGDYFRNKLKEICHTDAVKTRVKTAESAYEAFKHRSKPLKDINGARVLCDSPDLCYTMFYRIAKTLGIPNGLIDLIFFPRPNGYQSIIADFNMDNRKIEVQIQTPQMQNNAESGLASNYRQKI